ncbi:MAG: PRC-barrel domain-containing protein [Candidatus Korobacteraceae bacterium]
MLRRVRDIHSDYLEDLRGTTVYGPGNEKLGTVDDALVDDRSGELRYLLIDAGWLHSRRFLLPADQVYAAADGNELYAHLRQQDVETLPEFRDDTLASNAALAAYESDYRRAWRFDSDPARVRTNSRLDRLRERLRKMPPRTDTADTRSAVPATYVASGVPRPTGVYGVYSDRKDVEKAVERLRDAGFVSSDISVVFPDRDLSKEFALEKNTKAPEGALAGGGTGLVIGGALGWLAGIGTLAIPGIGPLLAAGPIVAAIAGAGVGSAIGGIAGALIGLGVPEIEAKRYEEEIKRGRILVSVHCDSVHMAQTARKVLDDTGAKDVFLSGEQRAA